MSNCVTGAEPGFSLSRSLAQHKEGIVTGPAPLIPAHRKNNTPAHAAA